MLLLEYLWEMVVKFSLSNFQSLSKIDEGLEKMSIEIMKCGKWSDIVAIRIT